MKRFLVFLSVCAACGGGGGDETYDPQIDPAHFVATVDNQYFPLVPGTTFEYLVQESGEHVVVTVTSDTKVILGVTCVVVHDVADIGGTVIEDTYDWYAQDDEGNVWYLGEETKDYENGKVTSTKGSWEAGVDGAEAGIVMHAKPEIGTEYRQEHYAGHAEDMGKVISLDERVQVPTGSYDEVLMTKDWTPLEPDVLEHKFYARGVGLVLALGISGGTGREVLVSFTK